MNTTTITPTITEAAQAILANATPQGQRFISDISESFSAVSGVQAIAVDDSTNNGLPHIAIRIVNEDGEKNHTFYILNDDLHQDGFNSLDTASELVRLYTRFVLREE